MYFKNILLFFMCIVLFIVTYSCTKKCDGEDPKIVGRWSDSNVRYYFFENKTYGLKYLRINSPTDTITTTDSAFGNYIIDKCRSNITFTQLGSKPRNANTIIFKTINAGTWEYSFPGDSVLAYKSLTSIGQYFKINN